MTLCCHLWFQLYEGAAMQGEGPIRGTGKEAVMFFHLPEWGI